MKLLRRTVAVLVVLGSPSLFLGVVEAVTGGGGFAVGFAEGLVFDFVVFGVVLLILALFWGLEIIG